MKRHFWTLACDQFSELLLSANKLIDQSPNTHVMPKVNDTFVNGVMDNEKHDTMNFCLLVFIIFSLKIEFFFFHYSNNVTFLFGNYKFFKDTTSKRNEMITSFSNLEL